MRVTHTELCKLIPHAEKMCLLDGVIAWDAESARCISNTHGSLDNPLRENGQLAAVHAIEYAAQAMAVHGGLLAQKNGGHLPPGLLVAVRNVSLAKHTLDTLDAPLMVTVRLLFADGGNLIYRFTVDCAGAPVAEGRLTVVTQLGEHA